MADHSGGQRSSVAASVTEIGVRPSRQAISGPLPASICSW
jgi:hypothetical protein